MRPRTAIISGVLDLSRPQRKDQDMRDWREIIVNGVLPAVVGDCHWEDRLRLIVSDDTHPAGLHLAVLIEPYLTYILDGTKTVESRFGVQRRAPYGQVAPEDVILLKESGGPVIGLCLVSEVWSYRLNASSWQEVTTRFTEALCVQDPGFWAARRHASYATLMRISSVRSIDPVTIPKSDRRGWVVLRTSFGHSGVLFD